MILYKSPLQTRRSFWSLMRMAALNWDRDGAQRLGAALAYYTVFSMAPLLMIVIAAIGLFLGQEAAYGLVASHLEGFMGTQNAQIIQNAILRLSEPSSGMTAGIIGIGTLILGALGVVGELQSSLNMIWHAPHRRHGISRLLMDRLAALAFILSLGFLLLVSLVLNAVVSVLGKYFGAQLATPAFLLQAINFGASFLITTLLFSLIFKILPEVKIAWHDVWTGAMVTSVLFLIGNFILGFYIGRSSAASAYGAAGSLILFLLWVYYCAQILYFGAEFTQVYASTHGSHSNVAGVPLKEKTGLRY